VAPAVEIVLTFGALAAFKGLTWRWRPVLRRRLLLVPPATSATLVVAALVFVAVCWFTESGPYRWLGMAKQHLFGLTDGPFPLTGIQLATLVLGAAVLVLNWLGKRRDAALDPDFADALVAVAGRAADTGGNKVVLGVAIALPLFFILPGLGFLAAGLLGPNGDAIDVAALEAGGAAPTAFVDVRGRLLFDRALEYPHVALVPIVSPRWRPGDPVSVYLWSRKSDLPRFAAESAGGRIAGFSGPARLSNEMRARLAAQDEPPAAGAAFLDARHTSRARRLTTARAMLIVGLGFGALLWLPALGLLAVRRARGRDRSPPEG
jgi:hypothetical protein